jgi:hypothetical protein
MKRKSTSGKDSLRLYKRTAKMVTCKKCQTHQEKTNSDVPWVICRFCVQEMVGMPEEVNSRVKSGKPRGWHFKKLFEFDGVVYSYGKEVLDDAVVEALRNDMVQEVKPPAAPKRRGRKNASNS